MAIGCSVDVFIEDRVTHRGPFRLAVEPTTTLKALKDIMEKDHNIASNTQRWILGRRLANNDQTTLQEYGVDSANCSLFLYIVVPGMNEVEPSSVLFPFYMFELFASGAPACFRAHRGRATQSGTATTARDQKHASLF